MNAVSTSARPALLCFDGSEGAVAEIVGAGEMLAPRMALVLTVWEPVGSWRAYDPATILSAPVSRLASKAFGLDQITRDLAREHMERGTELPTQAGFQADGRLEDGKPWRMICQAADALGAEPIVVGARGSDASSWRCSAVCLSTAVFFRATRPVLVVPHHERQPTAGSPPE